MEKDIAGFTWAQDHLISALHPVGKKPAVIIENGHGIILEDVNGKEYIDTCSQLTCVNLGYGRRDIINTAIAEMNKLQYVKLYHGFYTPAIIECGQQLAELTPEGLDYFYFTSGGSEANEMAFRYTQSYWHRKGRRKYKIISLFESYHGMTHTLAAVSGHGKGIPKIGIDPLPAGFINVPSYNCYYCMLSQRYPDCGIQCVQFIEKTILKEGPENVAAFIAEPVQGAGGIISPPPEFWPMIREICTKYEVLLIADEIMTGFCRTGKMFAVEHWGIKPDIMTLAKGITSAYMPLGVVVLNNEIFETLKDACLPGFTYSGQPIAAAVAKKTMEIYINEKIAEHAAYVGQHIIERLNSKFKSLPYVDNISGLGLMLGFNLVKDKTTKEPFDTEVIHSITDRALNEGLIIRISDAATTTGTRVVLTPPLIISIKEAYTFLDIMLPIFADIKLS